MHLYSSDHHVCLTTDTRGATVARVEWVFVMATAMPREEACAECARRESLEAVRFCANAEQLRDAAHAMLACVNVLDAIDACAAPIAAATTYRRFGSIALIEQDAPDG